MRSHDAKIFIRIAVLHFSCWDDLPCLQKPVQLKMSHYKKLAPVEHIFTIMLSKLVI